MRGVYIILFSYVIRGLSQTIFNQLYAAYSQFILGLTQFLPVYYGINWVKGSGGLSQASLVTLNL